MADRHWPEASEEEEDWSDAEEIPRRQSSQAVSSTATRTDRRQTHHRPEAPHPTWQLLQPPRLPTFRGEGDCSDFIAEVERILQHHTLDEGCAAEYIIQALGGSARREVLSHPAHEVATPEQVCNILKETFSDRSSIIDLLNSFYSRQQGSREELLNFAHDLQTIAKKANQLQRRSITDQLLRDRFITGLHSAELRRELRRQSNDHPQTTFLDSKRQALEWLSKERPDMLTASLTAQQSAEISELKQELSSLKTLMKELKTDIEKSRSSTSSRDVTCFYCKKRGHIKADCRSWKAFQTRRAAPSAVALPLQQRDQGN